MVAVGNSCRVYFLRCVISVLRRKVLPDLNASAVAVHVAEATDVHENVEAELMPGAEGPKHFIVLAAMAEAEIYDLAADNFACGRNGLATLAIRITTVVVAESGCRVAFQRHSFEYIVSRDAC